MHTDLHMCARAHRNQKKALGPLKLEFQFVMSHLLWVLES